MLIYRKTIISCLKTINIHFVILTCGFGRYTIFFYAFLMELVLLFISLQPRENNAKWWEIGSIQNDVMKWKALSQKADGSTYTETVEMTKVG